MDLRTATLITGGFYTCTPAWNSKGRQYADSHRLYFPRAGRAEFSSGEHTWTLAPGYVYLLPGYQMIQYRCAQKLTLDWLHFRPESLELDLALMQLGPGLRWPARQWAFWKPTYTRLQELFAARPAALECQTQAMLLWASAAVLAHPGRAAGTGAANAQAVLGLKPALEFMDRHFERNPALAEIATSVHLSPVYFHRRFTQALRLTPHEYLARKRMQRAWELLRAEGASVKEAAQRLNFASPFYFSRAFKKFFGTAPIDVRLGRVLRRP